MWTSFRKQLRTLKECVNLFDQSGSETRYQCLKNLHNMPLPVDHHLEAYFESLLFIAAYPSDAQQLSLAEKELLRISRLLKRSEKQSHKLLVNTGMPFTRTVTRFSHDKVRWLMDHPACKTTLDSFVDPAHTLNDVLKLTLPSIERSETTAGLENIALLDALKIPPAQRLPFLINELARLDHIPYIKDHLFDRLELYVCVTPTDKSFSKAYNRLWNRPPFFHRELLKRFDIKGILDSALPPPEVLTAEQKHDVVMVLKNAMAVTARETDPCTFMEENSLRLFHLERGFTVAIFGMIPSRQLPLESYVGYTAFKNGFPVSYGGAWIFGERANFGINVFESYRNGESAYLMSLLLRVYRHLFSIQYFEVEPYQFGLDNPEGITSGAFWFYYRFGFRPLDHHLRQIAESEAEKIKTRKGYRTSKKVLIAFTAGSIGLSLGRKTPPKVADIAGKITRMIQRTYKGDRLRAETDCREKFMAQTKLKAPADASENQVLSEVALWAATIKPGEFHKLELLKEMITTKPKDVFNYQALLVRYFSSQP